MNTSEHRGGRRPARPTRALTRADRASIDHRGRMRDQAIASGLGRRHAELREHGSNAWQLDGPSDRRCLWRPPRAAPAAIDSESLRLLLLGAQDMNTPQTVLRADIAIALETYKGPRTTQAVAFFVPGKEASWYLQLKEPALAALVRGSRAQGRCSATDGSIKTAVHRGADRRPRRELRGSQPLHRRRLQALADRRRQRRRRALPAAIPRSSRRTSTAPTPSTRPGRSRSRCSSTPRRLNNLVKLRTDSDHVLVGKKWFPGTIEVRTSSTNSKATLTIHWSQAASAPPELFAHRELRERRRCRGAARRRRRRRRRRIPPA